MTAREVIYARARALVLSALVAPARPFQVIWGEWLSQARKQVFQVVVHDLVSLIELGWDRVGLAEDIAHQPGSWQ